MKKYLNSTEKINSIRLKLRHPVSKYTIWILVEGEDDCKVYGKFINAPKTSIEQVHGGVEHLRIAVDTLVKETSQVIGIRDADFLHFNSISETIKHLFITDYHDIEMVMISSDNALNNLKQEFLNNIKIDVENLRTKILNSLIFLSNIRWFNDQNNCELNFKGLPLGKLYDPQKMLILQNEMVNEINTRSSNKRVEISIAQINKIMHKDLDLFQYTNGHDFIKAFALYISNKVALGVSPERLTQSLRLSYDFDSFKKTELYKQLLNFNKTNKIFSS